MFVAVVSNQQGASTHPVMHRLARQCYQEIKSQPTHVGSANRLAPSSPYLLSSAVSTSFKSGCFQLANAQQLRSKSSLKL